MRMQNKIGAFTALLAVGSLFSIAKCTADEMMPQTAREMRETRRAQAANRVSPKVTAMARANTLSYQYYQNAIVERAETSRRIHSQPHPHLFTKIGLVHQQMRKDHETVGNYPIEWFCYIKGNGVAIWDHRP